MTVVERTGRCNATRASVWAALADFGQISEWAPNVDHSCLMTDQLDGVGAVRRIQTDRATLIETVETWDPEVALAYRITGLPPVLKTVTNTWQLTEDGGATAISLTTRIDAGSRPPQRLISKAVGQRFAKASQYMIDGLIEFVEAKGLDDQ